MPLFQVIKIKHLTPIQLIIKVVDTKIIDTCNYQSLLIRLIVYL